MQQKRRQINVDSKIKFDYIKEHRGAEAETHGRTLDSVYFGQLARSFVYEDHRDQFASKWAAEFLIIPKPSQRHPFLCYFIAILIKFTLFFDTSDSQMLEK